MTKAVDFDGVIHRYSSGWQGGQIYDPPMPGAIKGLKTIMEVDAVVVFTARDDLKAVCAWLRSFGLDCVTQDEWDAECAHSGCTGTFWSDQERLLVTNKKPAASHYLDDRAVPFTRERGWDGALQDMDVMPSETIHTYLITVKLPKNPEHNPKRKQTGPCPVNGEPCSDVTGEHHTILIRTGRSLTDVAQWASTKYGHTTRVESVPGNIPF